MYTVIQDFSLFTVSEIFRKTKDNFVVFRHYLKSLSLQASSVIKFGCGKSSETVSSLPKAFSTINSYLKETLSCSGKQALLIESWAKQTLFSVVRCELPITVPFLNNQKPTSLALPCIKEA